MWKKIVGPVALLGLLWVTGGGFTTYYLIWLQKSLDNVMSDSMSTVRVSSMVEATLWRLQVEVIEAARPATSSPSPVDSEAESPEAESSAAESSAEAEFASLEKDLDSLRDEVASDEERNRVTKIASMFREYHGSAANNEEAGDTDRTTAIEQKAQLASSLVRECKELSTFEQELLTTTLDPVSIRRYGRLTKAVNALRLILLCSGPVIGVLLGLWITRSFRSTIHRLSVRLQDAALGVEKDLGHVDISPSGDLPELEKQVQEVSARLCQAAGELERGRRDAERADRLAAAGELAAGIAHELRNPLTSLKLLIQAAARKQRDRPLTDRQFQILQDEITRMEGTIQSLLDLTRPPKMRRRLHNLCSTLRRSLNLVRSRASQNEVQILEGLPNERIMVHGDPEQLHQVFVNLLLNALEAMPDGGTLRITIGGVSDEDTYCRIKCSDTGTGIPPDIIDQVFEPFVSGKEHGHGLGLAVSRRIVAEHGGSITAANRPEGGALFTVALPFVSIEPDSKPPGSDHDLATQRSPSDPDLAVQRPASDPEIAVQRPASDPEIAVQRPGDPKLAVQPTPWVAKRE